MEEFLRDVEEYIASAPEGVRPMVRELRAAIKEAAPEAEEKISYGMVGYFHKGNIIYFGIWKDHVGIYPMVGDVGELEKYRTSKGTASFPLDKKLPFGSIKRWVKVRVKKNEEVWKKKQVRTQRVELSFGEEPSDYLKKVMKKAEQNIKKGNHSPIFNTGEDEVKWLEKQGI